MDTGNSNSKSAIHADTFEVKGKKIYWELNGIKMVSKLEKMVEVTASRFGDDDRTQLRPVILLDFTFAGKLYQDMKFTIDDRGNKAPLLINRDFMKKVNLMIDPSRKFIITENNS